MKNNDKLDLSDIKDYDLDKTSSFTDLMSRSERKAYQRAKKQMVKNEIDKEEEKRQQTAILELMNEDSKEKISEKKKNKKLKKREENIEKINSTKEIENSSADDISIENTLGKTQLLEITKQMKFNFEETKEENCKKRKKGVSVLNIIGEINLFCIGYYIYLLVFTNYQDNQQNYLINGSIIVLLVLLFGLSVVTGKKASKFFNVLNFLAIIGFIIFNAYTLLH